MDNLYRELAPISAAAWTDLEEEVRRTFRRHIAGRRIVDVAEPAGPQFAGLGTGHQRSVDAPSDDVSAQLREVSPVVELRVPFTVDRRQVDAVERGATDADWQPAKDAARAIAFAEDRTIFHGFQSAGIAGLRDGSSLAPIGLTADASSYPDAVSKAVAALRLAGVGGPYVLALGADAYALADEAADSGYPIRRHIAAIVDDDIVWAPAISGGFVLSTRGGDFTLSLGQDLAIGYLSHDADRVELYLQETMTFFVSTAEAVVALPAAAGHPS